MRSRGRERTRVAAYTSIAVLMHNWHHLTQVVDHQYMSSEDKSIVKPAAAPPLTPLQLKSKLAPTPAQAPKYSVKVKNGRGQEVILADPRASRALVALMDMCAVNGGAASHLGGPAA